MDAVFDRHRMLVSDSLVRSVPPVQPQRDYPTETERNREDGVRESEPKRLAVSPDTSAKIGGNGPMTGTAYPSAKPDRPDLSS